MPLVGGVGEQITAFTTTSNIGVVSVSGAINTYGTVVQVQGINLSTYPANGGSTPPEYTPYGPSISGAITTILTGFSPSVTVGTGFGSVTQSGGTVYTFVNTYGQQITSIFGNISQSASASISLMGMPIALSEGVVTQTGGSAFYFVNLPPLQMASAYGALTTSAVVSAMLPSLSVAFSSGAITETFVLYVPPTISISGMLPAFSGNITILAAAPAYFTMTGALPAFSGNIYINANTTTFVISGSLPAFTTVWGYIHGSLPPFGAISETQAAFNGQVTYAMNIKTAETTQYSNYNFLAIIRIGKSYYGVRSDGVYLLGGIKDITQPIQAGFTTAQSSLGATSIKHVPFLYMDAQNPAYITQITDDETAGPFLSHPTGLKTKLSRGIRGKIWQFKVSNINGNQFRIGALEALSEITSHRVK